MSFLGIPLSLRKSDILGLSTCLSMIVAAFLWIGISSWNMNEQLSVPWHISTVHRCHPSLFPSLIVYECRCQVFSSPWNDTWFMITSLESMVPSRFEVSSASNSLFTMLFGDALGLVTLIFWLHAGQSWHVKACFLSNVFSLMTNSRFFWRANAFLHVGHSNFILQS